MKIVVYSGPPELLNEYLKVVEVHGPEQILGQRIVGYYPDRDLRVYVPLEAVQMIDDRIHSGFPYKPKR